MRKLNDQLLTGNSYTDRDPGLVNGRPQTYAVAPIYAEDRRLDAGRSLVREESKVLLQATPSAVRGGWLGSHVNQGLKSGSAALDPSTGDLLLRCWDNRATDGYYFLRQHLDGDFQATVKVLTWPDNVPWHAAGLEVRESLDARSRYIVLRPNRAVGRSWRNTLTGATFHEGVFPSNPVKLPLTLRLTRRGTTIAAQYSRDDGKSFHPAGDSVEFVPKLSKHVYVGLSIAAPGPDTMSEARCRDLTLRKL